MRLRLKITREGDLRYISHLDFVRLIERAVRCAGVPIAYSKGYNPRPKIAYSPALAVGISSETEFVDLWLVMDRDLRVIVRQLNEHLPRGARVVSGRVVPLDAKALTAVITDAEYEVVLPLGDDGKEIVAALESGPTDQDDRLCEIVELQQDMVIMRIRVGAGSRRGPKPAVLVSELTGGLLSPEDLATRLIVHRRRLFVGGDKGPPRPLEV